MENVYSYGCFQKQWYPQIIHFNRVFHYKPSILGYPYFWKRTYSQVNDQLFFQLLGSFVDSKIK